MTPLTLLTICRGRTYDKAEIFRAGETITNSLGDFAVDDLLVKNK